MDLARFLRASGSSVSEDSSRSKLALFPFRSVQFMRKICVAQLHTLLRTSRGVQQNHSTGCQLEDPDRRCLSTAFIRQHVDHATRSAIRRQRGACTPEFTLGHIAGQLLTQPAVSFQLGNLSNCTSVPKVWLRRVDHLEFDFRRNPNRFVASSLGVQIDLVREPKRPPIRQCFGKYI